VRVFEGRIEEDEKLAGDGGEGEFGSFTSRAELLVKSFEDGIFADGREAGEIEEAADWGAASPDVALTAPLATVAIQRRKASELGDGTASEGTEFRHEAEQAERGAPVDPRRLIQASRLRLERGRRVAQGEQLRFELGDLAVIKPQDPVALAQEPRLIELMATGFFYGALGDEMLALSEQTFQAQQMRRQGQRRCGSVDAAVFGKDEGIEPIGFGQEATGAGQIADLARVDHTDGDAMSVEIRDEGSLITAAFANDVHLAVGSGEAAAQEGEAGGRIGNGEVLLLEVALDGGLGEVCAEIDKRRRHGEYEVTGLALPYDTSSPRA
jgi:hypothetical protein